MGIGLRIFLINHDDSIQRLWLARYERLLRNDPAEMLPEYAGRRVRYAMVMLEVAGRKPLEIVRMQYSFLDFDSEGRIDASEREREAKLAMEMLPPLAKKVESGHLVDARHKFAQRRYDGRYKWTPNPETEVAIMEAIFGKERG
jgi:hypothetical protein